MNMHSCRCRQHLSRCLRKQQTSMQLPLPSSPTHPQTATLFPLPPPLRRQPKMIRLESLAQWQMMSVKEMAQQLCQMDEQQRTALREKYAAEFVEAA